MGDYGMGDIVYKTVEQAKIAVLLRLTTEKRDYDSLSEIINDTQCLSRVVSTLEDEEMIRNVDGIYEITDEGMRTFEKYLAPKTVNDAKFALLVGLTTGNGDCDRLQEIITDAQCLSKVLSTLEGEKNIRNVDGRYEITDEGRTTLGEYLSEVEECINKMAG